MNNTTKTSNDMLYKSNVLIESSYELTTAEIRLVDIALVELTEYARLEKALALVEGVEVTAEQYASYCNVSMSSAYEALRDASKQLFSREFTYEIKEPEKTKKKHEQLKKSKKIRQSRWVSAVDYIESQGKVQLYFTPELVEMAGQLLENFTRLHLVNKAPLTSQYAHRLYEMMLQWRLTTTVPYITYAELRERFGIADDEYKRVSNFKLRVLNPAIEQINKHTDIEVEYKQHKEGRAIAGFIFKFKFKKQPEKQKTDTDTKKAKSIESKAFVPLTLGQQVTFASKLANDATFNSKVLQASQGESMKDYTFRVQQALSKYENQVAWLEHLERLGFKATYK